MADLVTNLYSFDDDTMQRLMKDLNYMFTHLDERNVKRIYTEYCDIQSKDGETVIYGPLIRMRAPDSTTIRLEMGWSTASSEFKFNLYTSDGDDSVYINDQGDAEFAGVINTEEHIYTRGSVFIGWDKKADGIPDSTLLSTEWSEAGLYIVVPTSHESTGIPQYMLSFSYRKVIYGESSKWYGSLNSSAITSIRSKNTLHIGVSAGYGEPWDSTSDVNSTDYMDIWTNSNRLSLNSDWKWSPTIPSTTHAGTVIGKEDKSVFIATMAEDGPQWYEKVPNMYDLGADYTDRLRYYWMHNVRKCPDMTTTPNVITNLHLLGSTYNMATTYGIRMYPLTTTVAFHQIDYNLGTALDFEDFNDGTEMTSDDKFVVITYISSTAILDSNYKVYVALGNSSNARSNFYTTEHNYTTGWNVFSKAFSPNSVTGAPVMSAVNWLRVGWYGGHSTSHFVVVDYIGVIRASINQPTTYNNFVREVNSTSSDQWFPDWMQAVLVNHGGKVAICQTPSTQWELSIWDMWLRSAVQNFQFEIDNYSMHQSYTPTLTAYIDSSNYVSARVSSGVLRLFGLEGNTTFGRTINCDAFAPYKETKIKLKRNLGTWTASFEVTTDPMTFREVVKYDGPGTKWEDFCALYIGESEYGAGTRIHGIKVNEGIPYGG